MGLAVMLVNRLITALYKKTAREFFADLKHVDSTCEKVLFDILSRNKDTVYGKKYGFADIKTVAEYQKRVPITVYNDYKRYIDKIALGDKNILTKSQVNMFEITGGSGGHVKLIPYTSELKSEFLQGIKPWIYSLYTTFPALKNGKSYWSITPPAFEKKYTEGGIPIGFEDDTAYFGKIEQFLTDIIFVRDKSVKSESDMHKFYFKTALALLKAYDLSLISVWNPSYLLILLRFINENESALISALPKRRRKEIGEHIKSRDYEKIWKKLTLISCWCDGLAESGANEIRENFPNVHIQPKGILATEAFMTLPYLDSAHSILSYKSHYFEFLHINSGEITNYTSLKLGEQYEIIFTTSGGFYRYKINDAVKVMEITKQGLPLLKFVGKTDKTSDYHGEKLNEIFIKESLEKIYCNKTFDKKHNLRERFKLLAYENSRYVLYLYNCSTDDKDFIATLESAFESALCESYHYKLCRDLRQLKPVKVRIIYGDVKAAYLDFYLRKGKKLGDIKPELLSLHSGWSDSFKMEDDK